MVLPACAILPMRLLLQLLSALIVEQFFTSAIRQLTVHVGARAILCGIVPAYHATVHPHM